VITPKGAGKAEMDKKHAKPNLRDAARYFLLQLPGQLCIVLLLFLFRQWVDIPGYLMWVLPALWVVKDILLFPFLWRYYASDKHPDPSRMIGRKGVALCRLAPDGHVLVKGERWRASIAHGGPPVEKGESICVKAVDGLGLTVVKCEEDS
jgi:membrane protein implicated in regulation of membrane protease activity